MPPTVIAYNWSESHDGHAGRVLCVGSSSDWHASFKDHKIMIHTNIMLGGARMHIAGTNYMARMQTTYSRHAKQIFLVGVRRPRPKMRQ